MKIFRLNKKYFLLGIFLIFIGLKLEIALANETKDILRVLFFMRTPNDISGRAFIRNQIFGLKKRGHVIDVTYFLKSVNDAAVKNLLRKFGINNLFYYQDLLKKPQIQKTYDVIICHSGADYAPSVNKIRKSGGLLGKFVVFLRGWNLKKGLVEKKPEHINLFKDVDLFFSVCEYIKERIIELGCPSEKVVILRSGIDCSKFRYSEHAFCSTGQISLMTVTGRGLRKGIPYMIKAVAQIIKKYPNVKFTLVGPHNVNELIRKLPISISKNIISLGWQHHDKLPNILAKANLFMAVSVTGPDGSQEGIPTAVKEAMACGIPPITSHHAGIPELIKDKKSGFLVNEKDVDDLVNKLEYLINNPKICIKAGKQARHTIETEHNNEIENDKFENFLLNLVLNS